MCTLMFHGLLIILQDKFTGFSVRNYEVVHSFLLEHSLRKINMANSLLRRWRAASREISRLLSDVLGINEEFL
uniref:Uncharacterized protein n=1 Tax=Romanomermis culicivorax TaxID=13658 RepID=A0A915IWH3_ROMCU